MKKALSKEKFLTINQQMPNKFGDYKAREYLGLLKKDDMLVVLWKSAFRKAKNDVFIRYGVVEKKIAKTR